MPKKRKGSVASMLEQSRRGAVASARDGSSGKEEVVAEFPAEHGGGQTAQRGRRRSGGRLAPQAQ
eukprot:3877728-Lingulodinium_polyedra.AAC.1